MSHANMLFKIPESMSWMTNIKHKNSQFFLQLKSGQTLRNLTEQLPSTEPLFFLFFLNILRLMYHVGDFEFKVQAWLLHQIACGCCNHMFRTPGIIVWNGTCPLPLTGMIARGGEFISLTTCSSVIAHRSSSHWTVWLQIELVV